MPTHVPLPRTVPFTVGVSHDQDTSRSSKGGKQIMRVCARVCACVQNSRMWMWERAEGETGTVRRAERQVSE